MIDRDNGFISDTFTPRYNLSSNELSTLTEDLLCERASNLPDTLRYITIEVNGDHKCANIGRHIERVVFEEVFGNDVQQMTEEYGLYEAHSKFFIAIDRATEQPTGVLRVIGNSPQGLKSLNDAQQEPFNVNIDNALKYHAISDLDTVWDIGTVAMLPDYRGSSEPSSIQLYRAMYLSALEHGIEHLVSIMDDKLLRMLKGHLAMPFEPLANSEPGPYLGSEKSHAVYAHVPEFHQKMSNHKNTIKSRRVKRIIDYLLDENDKQSIILGQ